MFNNRSFEKIESILNRTIKNIGLEQKIKEVKILSLWEEVVGEQISKHTKPLYIHKGTFFIETDSPIWSNEIGLLKKEIKEKLNKKIGTEIVKKIYLKVNKGNVSSCRLPDCNLERHH